MAVRRHNVHWDITADTGQGGRALAAFEGNLKSVNAAAEGMARTFRGALVATALVGLTRESARAAMEAEQQQARLSAVLRATGHAAGMTRRELDELADSLADATQFDDESYREGISTLLKFGNVQGDVLKEGLKLSADLAAFMGTSVPEAAQLIGKSLQSPTEGLTAMERQFGKLTTAQKENIETLVRQGRAMEAQQAVLDIWRSKIGGTAAEMNTGLKEASSGVGKAWGEMLEAIGRTEIVGGTARDILGGIRDILKDIKGLTEGGRDPMKIMLLSLEGMNEELARLEAQSAGPTQAQRAGLGQAATEAARAQLDGRIAELKSQREQLLNAIRVLQMTGDPGNMDTRDRRLAMPRPIALGGDDDAAKREAERARQLREQDIRNLVRAAEEVQDEAEKLIYTWDLAGNRVKVTREEFKKMQEEQQRAIDAHVKSAEISTEIAEGMIYTWDRAGNRVAMTRDSFEAMIEQQKKSEELAKDLGFTFSSAFEDAIVKGEKLRTILQGLAQDILRIVVRQTITQPMAAGLTGFLAGMFGAGQPQQLAGPPRASGGPVLAGVGYTVGELGPELFVPRTDGDIIPTSALSRMGSGSVVVHVHQSNSFHADFRVAARAEINSMLPQIAETARAATYDMMQRGVRP